MDDAAVEALLAAEMPDWRVDQIVREHLPEGMVYVLVVPRHGYAYRMPVIIRDGAILKHDDPPA